MEAESMDRLGFVDDNSWENEEQEKEMTFKKIQAFKQRAFERTMQQKKFEKDQDGED